MGELMDIAYRVIAEQNARKKRVIQDKNKEFHQLLITTLRETEKYKFTDTPLCWAKKHNCKPIVLEMFRYETNLNESILEKHLEEARYWANKLINSYKELKELKNQVRS